MKHLLAIIVAITTLVACGNKVPVNYDVSAELPHIYPDYANVTIPVNMAPLTFEAEGTCDGIVARMTAGEEVVVCGGSKIQPDADDWQRLTASAKGDAISVEVFIRQNDQWTRFKPFNIYVSPDSIDPYISYRLIAPSYIAYEGLTISQRCLENYDERVIYDNMLCGFEVKGQCINCHNYQQYNPERMQFHARQNHGGTVIAYDGQLKKVNMANDSIISAGVYPAWHPWLKLIVYSTNHTHQSFFVTNRDKIEVYDSESDLIAYDIDSDEVTNIENRDDELEVFPAWSPDGRTLYYSSAHFVRTDSIDNSAMDIIAHYDSLHYNIYRKRFDPDTKQFGPRELVICADSLSALSSQLSPLRSHPGSGSALLPRISPDGRFLLFSMADHGVFPIWHHDADLWLMDLQSGETRPLIEVNSPDTESYHTCSSNGRWIVFSSRRDDGAFTRPFFAHVDSDGRCSKPFELPSADPGYHRQLLKCYNIPELMRGPVPYGPHDFAPLLKGDGTPVKYVQQLSK